MLFLIHLSKRSSWFFAVLALTFIFCRSTVCLYVCSPQEVVNKSKLLPHRFPGVYQLDCTCNALYIGETKKKVITRTIEHQQDSFNGKWESSGATEHCLECHGQFNWINPKTLSTEQQYHRRKIRESLEIKKTKTIKRRKVLNHDEANLVKTNTWIPLFAKLTEKETKLKT